MNSDKYYLSTLKSNNNRLDSTNYIKYFTWSESTHYVMKGVIIGVSLWVLSW